MEVTKDDMEIVSGLRATLADKVGKERFELWFGTGTWFRLDQRALTIGVPNRFFRDWIRSNFRRQIESACLEIAGQLPHLEVQRGRRRGRSRLAAVRGGQGRSARCRAAADEAGHAAAGARRA